MRHKRMPLKEQLAMDCAKKESYKRSVGKNSVTVSLCRFGGLLVGILVTPILVKQLGSSLYGLYSVVLSSAAAIGSLDVGLANSFLKHINEYLTKGEIRLAKATASAALGFYVALVLVFVPLSYALAPYIVNIINTGSEDRKLAAACLVYAVGYVMANGLANIPSQIVTAMHRMDLVAIVALASQILGQTIAILLVVNGFGIQGIIIGLYAQVALTALANIVLAVKMIGWPFGSVFALHRDGVTGMLKYGGWMQLAGLTGIFQSQSDKIVIGAFVNLSSVTSYEIGNKIALLGRNFPLALCAASFPAISSIAATGDQQRLLNAYVKASNMLALLTLFFGGLLIGGSEHLILVWMGQAIPHSAAILCMLVVALSVNTITGIGTMVLRAKAMLKYEVAYGYLQLAVNIAVSIVCGYYYGLYGIVTGTLAGATAGSVYFMVCFHRVERISWWHTVGKTLVRIIIVAAASGTAFRLLLTTVNLSAYSFRIQGLLYLALFGLAYCLVFAIGASLAVPECVESMGPYGSKISSLIRRVRRS